MPMVPIRSVDVRILSSPVPMRMPYCSRIRLTTAAGSTPLGARVHATVFDTMVGSGNISSPMAATPARSAPPAMACRRARLAMPSSRIRRTATCRAAVRCVGIEMGCRRGVPSGILPPRETGTQLSRQRSRSYAYDCAVCLRRSIASQARGLTDTSAMPRGAARHFCEPVMLRSTPHSSVRTSSPAIDDTVSSMKSAPTERASVPTSAAGYVVPVEVSLCTRVMAFGRTRSASRARRSMSRRAPHSTGNSVASAPTRLMISRMSRPKAPAPTTSTRSPGSITESAPASSAVRPEPGMMRTSCLVWKTSRSASVVGSSTVSSKPRSYWMAAGWLSACTTGHGSSVGPGIISIGRVCTWVQLIAWLTLVSSRRGSDAWIVSPRGARLGGGQRGAAGGAEVRLGRARVAAARTVHVRVDVAAMDDEVADVGDPGEEVREDEDRVALVQGVDQQEQRAGQAQPPEGGGDHHALAPLGRVPLHEEAREEDEIAEPADDLPAVQYAAQQ